MQWVPVGFSCDILARNACFRYQFGRPWYRDTLFAAEVFPAHCSTTFLMLTIPDGNRTAHSALVGATGRCEIVGPRDAQLARDGE